VNKSKKTFVRKTSVGKLSGKKALICDDNINNLNILSHILDRIGMSPVQLQRGEKVIPVLEDAADRREPFEICILDIQMPDISGYEIAERVRHHKDPKISNLPLLAFSSSTARMTRRYRESGFDGFLPKPIQRKKMVNMIKRLLGGDVEKEDKVKRKVMITQHSLVEEAKHSVRILLAEDNPLNQKLAKFMLSKAGYQLEIANNGREAVDRFAENPGDFDLIFMDIHMPELDGISATTELRKKGFKDIPIIAMTADAMKGDREKCIKSGMNDYMSKPIKREVVFGMVRKWALGETE
jgi:CheY-like chemotaxis protein